MTTEAIATALGGRKAGDGPLRRVLKAAASEACCSSKALTVLATQNDPYRVATQAGHRNGAWLAVQFERAVRDRRERRIHQRGLHYAIVAAGDVVKPNGDIYSNTDADWMWLQQCAVKAARWLGYVPFAAITDERNAPPVIHRRPRVEPEPYVQIGIDVSIPDVDDLEPYAGASGFVGRQPYHLVIFGEKASIGEVILPIARRFDADVYLPSGEISEALVYQMAKDAAEDGRPMVVFTIADFDPAGWQMPVSIGRKLQAFRDLLFPDLQFAVRPVALTGEHVREHDLPSTPLKETERRADRWPSAFGVEQTEIDALAQLRPQILERIVHDAMAPFYDETLRRRVALAEETWRGEAQEWLANQIDGDALDQIRADAADKLSQLQDEIDALNERLRIAANGRFSLPPIEIPEPIVDLAAHCKPLTSSTWSWADATRALIARKSYGNAEDQS